MGFWDLFSDNSKKYAKIGTQILDRPRAGYYPVEPKEIKKSVAQTYAPAITFEVIQNSIKEELEKVTNKITTIDEKDTKIKELQEKLSQFKDNNKDIYNKIKDLKSVGLVNTPSSKSLLLDLEEQEKEIKSSIYIINSQIRNLNKIKEAANKYALKYPTFKFIDTESFTNVLKKYNLVLGDSSLYCKEIPDNVLTNIVKFKESINKDKKYIHLIHSFNRSWSRSDERFTISESDNEYYDRKNYINNFDYTENSIYNYCKTNLVIAAPFNHFKNEIISVDKRSDNGSKNNINVNLFIVDKNTRELIIDEKAFTTLAQNNNEISRKIDDPIACLKVDEGFIIIDAWDKEALIPEICRETLN